jgi:serine protease AprX
MKKLFLILFSLATTFAVSQVAPDKYFVRFTDKDNSPYSISDPLEYLSQRAIDRRADQGIPIHATDLPVNPQYLEGVEQAGADILNPSKWLNGVSVRADDPSIMEVIEGLPFVVSTTRISQSQTAAVKGQEKSFFKNEIYDQAVPANNFKSGSGIMYDYGLAFNQITMLNGDQMHDQGYRGQGLVIAVLDAGFIGTDTHPAFDSIWMNDQVLGTRDFVDGGEVTFTAHPHGTMVLGTMAANEPGEMIGTAPMASYWLLRSEDGGSEYIIEEYNWVTAAEFADSAGADIINSSLGYTTFNDPSQNHSYDDMDGNTTPITTGADFAASKGMLVVNSLGNDGNSSWYYLAAPSDGDSVMGVGAVDGNGNYASFSSHGPSADGRVKPNLAAQGSGVYTVDPWNTYTFSGGTSFSSPIMAGMSACLWQANPDMTNMEILSALQQSASQYTNPDDFLGYGIPDIMMANNILTIIDGPEGKNVEVAAYPNPFDDYIRIEVRTLDAGLEKSRVEVIDLAGKVVISESFDANKEKFLDTGRIPSGIYFMKVFGGNGQPETIKIIKR